MDKKNVGINLKPGSPISENISSGGRPSGSPGKVRITANMEETDLTRRVAEGTVVSLRYRICDQDGLEMENTFNRPPAEYFFGSGLLMPQLESALVGMRSGMMKKVWISDEFRPGSGFQVHLAVDQVRLATEEEIRLGKPVPVSASGCCGPEGCC